ncbi:tetratricopeptide repeat protein [Kitasatospora sp. NPDC048540]|uniref:ATP-binding protein n=1 Tax=Kitasatospora sp. NPDC048540 TaxID=3155634 RepID=UPI0033D45809
MRLLDLRAHAALSREELAAVSGVSVRALADMERGRSRGPQRRTVQALAGALSLSPQAAAELESAARLGRPRPRPNTRVPAHSLPSPPRDTDDLTARETLPERPALSGSQTTGVAGRRAPALPDGPQNPHPAPVRRPPVPAQLPAVGRMWGRDAELARLEALVAHQDGPAVVAVDGMAGAGKTTFALWLARRVSPSYPDGVLFADLHTHSPAGEPSQPGEVAAGLLRALGTPPQDLVLGPAGRTALLRSVLAQRRVVVVLDDAERASQVAPLLPGTGGSLVLVTSRRRLTGLSVRHGAMRLTLEPLAADEAVLLLRGVLERRAAGWETVDEAALAVIARRCAYLPLALQIAAERLAERGPAFVCTLARELEADGRRLEVLSVPGEAETAVRSVFAWSYRTLNGELSRAFDLLALHPGAVSGTAAAAALWGVSATEASRLFGELYAAHLVAEVSPGRYRMHDLLREFALECAGAQQAQTLRGARERVVAWYLHAAEAAADQLLGRGRHRVPIDPLPEGCQAPAFGSAAQALQWCERERENLVACARQARAARSPAAWQLPYALWGFRFLRHHHHEQLEAGQAARAALAGQGDPVAEACVEVVLASARAGLRQHAAADVHYRQAISCFGAAGDGEGEGMALLAHAMSCMRQGRSAEAAGQVERALGLFRAANCSWGTAQALSGVGEGYLAQGRAEAALEPLALARALHHANGSLWLEASVCTLLGTAHRELGDHARAQECYQQALRLHERTGMRAGSAHALHQLGACLDIQNRPRQARQVWLQAWSIYQALADPREAEVRARLAALVPCRPADAGGPQHTGRSGGSGHADRAPGGARNLPACVAGSVAGTGGERQPLPADP